MNKRSSRINLGRRKAIAALRKRVTLRGRRDLSAHFWVSAALAVLSDQRRSMTVGIAKEMMDATRSGNQRRIDKAQRRQQELLQQQTAMTNSRMRSSMLFTLPMLLIWRPLGDFFAGTVIAHFPFNFPYIPREFSFFQWYLLCSFSLNTIMNRVFGLTFEIDPED